MQEVDNAYTQAAKLLMADEKYEDVARVRKADGSKYIFIACESRKKHDEPACVTLPYPRRLHLMAPWELTISESLSMSSADEAADIETLILARPRGTLG